MAKSKNHTAHNQSYKAHRNGIKRPTRHFHPSRKGVRSMWLWLARVSRLNSFFFLVGPSSWVFSGRGPLRSFLCSSIRFACPCACGVCC